MSGNNGAEEEGRMVHVGRIFNPTAAGKPTQERVLAGLYDLPELGEQNPFTSVPNQFASVDRPSKGKVMRQARQRRLSQVG